MRTHELADALKKLALTLKRGPDMDLRDLENMSNLWMHSPVRPPTDVNDIPWALNALVSLAQVDKQEWIQLVAELGLDVEIRSRDASRDILGKVLRVLEAQPEARDLLERKVRNKGESASPELARALSSLLRR